MMKAKKTNSQFPKGQKLIELAREYSDSENNKLSQTLSFELQILDQKIFLKVVKWLISKGY